MLLLPAGGPLRCDWEVRPSREGEAKSCGRPGAAQRRPRVGSRGDGAGASAGQAGGEAGAGALERRWAAEGLRGGTRAAGRNAGCGRNAGSRRPRWARGRHPGGRPGGGSPHLRGGGGGVAAAHGGAGGARRRRRARSYAPEPLGMRAGGRPGRARPGPARLGGGGGSDGGGDSGGSGAGRGRRPHPTAAAAAAARLLLRSCCGSCSPAERGGRRRRRLPLSPASRLPRPVPLPLPLPGRCLLSAARVSHQTPPPPVQRRAGGRAAAAATARTRPGPLALVGACVVSSPFSGGTEAKRRLRARGRPRTGQARSRNGAGLLPGPGDAGQARGVARSPRWERNSKSSMAYSAPTAACHPEESEHNKPSREKG